ncbi:DUF742 domain-containing protein [Streptomyces chrestomyceticus]|uniref:DUF742 domain-containing protein n=1 Tax=Streptomyces chrestomyceticus TaxID=68185 RepID=UPI0033FA70F5
MAAGGGWSSSTLGDVRPYLITAGRTRPKHTLHLSSTLITRPATRPLHTTAEHEALLLYCSGSAQAVSELSGRLGQPVQAIKVLAGDLLDVGALMLANPDGPTDPEVPLLEALLEGLCNLP